MEHYTRRVTGRATAGRARVIWRNKRLYVFAPRRDVQVFDAPDKPAAAAPGTYTTAGVQWEKGPCGCGFPSALKRPAGRLVREADALIADGAVVVQPLEQETIDA